MNPGAIQFTRTLIGPSSFAKALVNPKNIFYQHSILLHLAKSLYYFLPITPALEAL
jgi:hypothetical protein